MLIAATRRGLPATYGGLHGTAPFGDLCRAAIADAGVDVAQPPFPNQDTGFTVRQP